MDGRVSPNVSKPSLERVALSPREFALLFGKEQTWGYRQIYSGKVKAITEYGRILIPAAEIERILKTAGVYDGLKPKVRKADGKLEAWQQFIVQRRKAKGGGPVLLASRSRPPGSVEREAALARLERGRSGKH